MEDFWQKNPFGNCFPVNDYQKLGRIGQGTYGYVYLAKHKATNNRVALKRIILYQDDFPLTSIREIITLKRCRHQNIVNLIDVVVGGKHDAIFLAFEYCEYDLQSVLKNIQNPFTEAEIKTLILQLLSAVNFIHKNWIVHRDIKLSNLLYTSKGKLKLADFGLARTISYPTANDLTPTVVTLWYRAPEILLGSSHYSFAIDLWSVGCVLAELLLSQPLFQGDNELQQIHSIFKVLGSPNDRIWPELNDYILIRNKTIDINVERRRFVYNNLRDYFPKISDEGLDLLNLFFTYQPNVRITARDALNHIYFNTFPYPKDTDLMPSFPNFHESLLIEKK